MTNEVSRYSEPVARSSDAPTTLRAPALPSGDNTLADFASSLDELDRIQSSRVAALEARLDEARRRRAAKRKHR